MDALGRRRRGCGQSSGRQTLRSVLVNAFATVGRLAQLFWLEFLKTLAPQGSGLFPLFQERIARRRFDSKDDGGTPDASSRRMSYEGTRVRGNSAAASRIAAEAAVGGHGE
jgi:hypothetical protein